MTILIGVIGGGLFGYAVSSYMNKRNVYTCTLLCNKKISVLYFSFIGALFASSI